MSQSLDLVRSIYADWERGDFSETDWVDPAVEYMRVGDGPASGVWSGKDEMASAVREWLSPWKDLRMVAEQYQQISDGRVLVLGRQTGRGTRSGLDIESQTASLFELQGTKVTRLIQYTTHDRALADLGLED